VDQTRSILAGGLAMITMMTPVTGTEANDDTEQPTICNNGDLCRSLGNFILRKRDSVNDLRETPRPRGSLVAATVQRASAVPSEAQQRGVLLGQGRVCGGFFWSEGQG
jgi:hypothetical protein